MNDPCPEPLRVLHFIDNLGPGGKERQLVELLKGCAADGGFRSLVVSMSRGVFYNELKDIARLELRFLVRRWRKDPLVLVHLWRMVREFGPDALVAWDHMTAVYSVPVARLGGVRLVNAMIQDAPRRLSPRARWRARITFPFSDVVVANSAAGLAAYGVRKRRSAVLHNGFDLARVSRLEPPAAVRHRHGLGDALVVGMVATFRETKDQPTLIAAAAHILARRTDVVFVLVGDGETLQHCRQLAADLPAPRLHFTGAIGDGLESLIASFDVGVLATFTEGISNSIMEYMALGKPVVASDGGGTVELVEDGVTGLLVPPGDVVALAAAIERILDDPDLRRRMGEAGQRRIEEAFSIATMVKHFRHLCTP